MGADAQSVDEALRHTAAGMGNGRFGAGGPGEPPRMPACTESDRAALKRRFLAGLRETGTIYRAAMRAGIERNTALRWRDEDEEFDRACRDALEDSTEQLEDSVYERAFKSDLLAMFTLKGRRPAVYRDNARVEVVGAGGAPLGLLQALPPEQLATMLREAADAVQREAADVIDIPAQTGDAEPSDA